jgi:hypothetical protein
MSMIFIATILPVCLFFARQTAPYDPLPIFSNRSSKNTYLKRQFPVSECKFSPAEKNEASGSACGKGQIRTDRPWIGLSLDEIHGGQFGFFWWKRGLIRQHKAQLSSTKKVAPKRGDEKIGSVELCRGNIEIIFPIINEVRFPQFQ